MLGDRYNTTSSQAVFSGGLVLPALSLSRRRNKTKRLTSFLYDACCRPFLVATAEVPLLPQESLFTAAAVAAIGATAAEEEHDEWARLG